jgi:molybdenum cofactor cytidylyltransferase
MIFGPVAVEKALGAILAHSVELEGTGRPAKLPKGTVLTEAHLARLAGAGVAEVVAARLEPGDLHEDAAAARIAAALPGAGGGLEIGASATGRVNLRATVPGLLEIDAAAIDAANRVHPAITIATVKPWTRLEQRGLAVTVKIIPFAAPEADVARVCAVAAGAVALRAPALGTATLIETRTGGATPPDKGRRAVKGRLDRFGVALDPRLVVPHAEAEIAGALEEAKGELLMILTGSATSDSADTAPAALRRAGGTVMRYGMPVDPGNLLFLGRLGERVVIGLPGCARSPALNGADWVMERVICGIDPADIDIAGMGVGGLLKEIPSRPLPRERKG